MLNNRLFKRHLEEEEEVIMIVHRHWLIGFKYLYMPVLCILFLLVLLAAARTMAVFYVVAILQMVTIVWLIRNFLDYYLDAWLITDTGIIDVEWHGWFHRESSRVLYSDIQGVSYEIQGVWSTLFRYGRISVEKVSTGSEISMENVKNPRAVEAVILRNMEGYLHAKNLKDAKTVQEVLAGVVARELQLQEFDDEDSGDDDA